MMKANGQSGNGSFTNQDRIYGADLMSPQSANFTKYGGHSVSHSTGEIELQIPIYTYSDKDFEIPVFIGYNSSGFQPNQRDGIVGLNWYLNAGGTITRTVNGVPDDSRFARNFQNGEIDGLFYGIKNNHPVKTKSMADLFNLTAGSVSSHSYWHVEYCEVEPDLFTFNLPGLSGKFFLQNNGEIKCIGSKPFRVDLSGVSIQHYPIVSDNVLSSIIKITTDDGYQYQLGGMISHLDVAFQLNYDDQATDPIINTWHLTKITAPNGRTVDYFYKKFLRGIH